MYQVELLPYVCFPVKDFRNLKGVTTNGRTLSSGLSIHSGTVIQPGETRCRVRLIRGLSFRFSVSVSLSPTWMHRLDWVS